MNTSLQDKTIRGMQKQRQTVTERYNALREQYLFWHMHRQAIQQQHLTQTSRETVPNTSSVFRPMSTTKYTGLKRPDLMQRAIVNYLFLCSTKYSGGVGIMLDEQDSSSSEANTFIHTILIIEDDKDIGSFLVEAIYQETPYHTLFAADGNQALNILHDWEPSLLLLDCGLPDMNGLGLYGHVHAIQELEDIPVLILSANCPWSEVKKRNIICLAKPVEIDELLKTIEHLLPLREYS